MKAKTRINQLMQQYYEEAKLAHDRGEKIGWISGNFPQEIVAAMDLCVIYPENHAAMLAMKGQDTCLCEVAEKAGFNDICSFAKVTIGYCLDDSLVQDKMPMPDYLLCCSSVCNQIMKWYRYLGSKYSIPLILIDIPYGTEYEADDVKLEYIKCQFYEAISRLEDITGHKFDADRLDEVLRISNRNGQLWNRINNLLRNKNTAFRGMDLFNYMGVIITQRGRQTTGEVLQALYEELLAKDDKSAEEKLKSRNYRIVYDGKCCWSQFIKLILSFEQYGFNMVSVIDANMWGLEYEDFDGMLRAYCNMPNASNLRRATELRVNEINTKSCDGMLVHMSKSCKMWSGIMYEMLRQIEKQTGIPTLTFDGEQADKRGFSESQFDTRLQGFYELMNEKRGQTK